MTVTLPLDQMTAEEKLQLIDILWESLDRESPNEIPLPEWHREILREREKLMEASEEHFIPLEELDQHVKDVLK